MADLKLEPHYWGRWHTAVCSTCYRYYEWRKCCSLNGHSTPQPLPKHCLRCTFRQLKLKRGMETAYYEERFDGG